MIDLRTRWITALRSGEYEQTTGTMRNLRGQYCCLGVLCDISAIGEWGENDGFTHNTYFVQGEAFAGVPSNQVMEAVGLTTNDAWKLSDRNDSGSTFTEIADLIESWEKA